MSGVRAAACAALLLCGLAAPAGATEGTHARYTEAVHALDAGRAAEAAARFAEIARETDAPDAWYALGTAELTAGRYGRAIWALEQAHAAAPDDADVQHNLDAARALVLRTAAAHAGEQRTVLPGDDDMGTGLVTALPPNLVASAFAAAWVAAFGLWAVSRRATGTPRGARAGLSAVGAGLVALVFGGLLVGRAVVLRAATYGVVVERYADAREGPGAHYPTTARLLSGVKVRVRGVDDGFSHVTLPDGSTGWVERRSVEALTDR
jgi:hypothetical protein